MIRITKDKSGEITVETDDGNASDHADAHKHSPQLARYMDDHEVSSVEGDDYRHIKTIFWHKDHDKSGYSSALSDLG